MEKIVISVAEDFSRHPAGRYVTDGDFSGEHFRTKFLIPILQDNKVADIKLDGVRGYGSSFLEEAFGGLVRLGYSKEKIERSFKLISEDMSLIEEIEDYIVHGNDE